MADEHPLPPIVARMWGREEAARHGPRPSLDTATVVETAIALADEKGLAGVTMSAVASKLKVAAMSLYRYVGSKDELLTMMADAAAPVPPVQGELGWREYVVVWTRAQLDHLRGRPWTLDIPRTGPPSGPSELRWLEAMLRALEATGLSVGERFNIAIALSGYAFAQAKLVHDLATPAQSASEEFASSAGYAAMLSAVLDERDYPILTSLARVDDFGSWKEWVRDPDFGFGLNLLCAGVESLIERSSGPRSAP